MKNNAQLQSVLEKLENTKTLEDLQGVIASLRDFFGVSHMIYHWVDTFGEQYGCGTYSDEWVERYLDQNYLRVDPVVSGCLQRFHPVDWRQLDWSSRAVRNFQSEAIIFGVGHQGYTIPIRGPSGQFAIFTVTDDCDDAAWDEFTETYGSDLILIAHYFNRKALEFETERSPEQVRPLSPREVDAMTLLAKGLSRAQVAAELSISEHTLRVYIESARFKLGAMNTTHAVARALSEGLITV